MFIDKAKILVKAGKGGDGIVAFRKEMFVPNGGPNGGDGGKGGNVIFEVDTNMRTLMDFRYKRKFAAENGQNGGQTNMSGKKGNDIVVKVPPGTIIKDEATERTIADLVNEGDRVIVAKGGNGGKGNQHFATATRQAPMFAESGQQGEEKSVVLELKLIADVGLVGFPNVGKSTLLSVTTSAKPKIANYHFTTLTPNLGVVEVNNTSFVLADIPGLIEGAHEGVGLGHEFLRHVERTKLLIHVIDVSGIEGRDPLTDFEQINEELVKYNPVLAKREQVVACNKMDLPEGQEKYKEVEEILKEKGYKVFPISAATNKGLSDLMSYVALRLSEIEKIPLVKEEEDNVEYDYGQERRTNINIEKQNNQYIISGSSIDRLLASTNFDDPDSLKYFQRSLRKWGIIDELKKLGIGDGDLVKMNDFEFEYYD